MLSHYIKQSTSWKGGAYTKNKKINYENYTLTDFTVLIILAATL